MESGPIAAWTARPLSVMEDVWTRAVLTFGCNGTLAHQRTCLRGVAGSRLEDALSVSMTERQASNVTAFNFLAWGPVIDGKLLAAHPLVLAKEGKIHKVPLLLGTNTNEGASCLVFSFSALFSLCQARSLSGVSAGTVTTQSTKSI